MKKRLRSIFNCILVLALLAGLTLQSYATTISDIQNQIKNDQNALAGINDNISDLEDEQDLIEEELSDLDAELLNTMTEIGVLEDGIAEKEAGIEKKQQEYAAAKADEDRQLAAMISQIQFLYESDESDYASILFTAGDFSDMLNRASYIEAIYTYNQDMLEGYIAVKDNVKLLWDQLEEEKTSLEADRAVMEEQKVYLDGLIERKRAESANYEAQIARARQEANALKKRIQQEQQELKKLQEEERRRAAANAAKGTYSVSVNLEDIIKNAPGSDLGKQIARYGCQFIGNPYVLGGTSLTNGADCSGFTYRIYQNFGYTLPRTSYQQRNAGTEVSYANAQPGDLICYEGHVALYIGGGYIVHASNAKSGIKISKATYRAILSVRRIL